MLLTDIKVRTAKPKDKPYKMADGDGMFLLVHPNNGKYWRLKYRYAGKEKILALGVYPETSLSDARNRRIDARKMLAGGNDPGVAKQEKKRLLLTKGENTFEVVARDWHKSRLGGWSENYAGKVMTSMQQDVFPKIGRRAIADITAPEMLAMLRLVEERGALETAHRVKQICSQVFFYAISCGLADRNPASDLKMALKVPERKHYTHLKAEELPEFFEKLEAYDGAHQTRLALKLLILTFVRTTELRGALWSEIDWKKAEWRIPAERMKMKEQHIVPLSQQSIDILHELQSVTGRWPHIFANQHKPAVIMSDNTILFALYRMGYHGRATGHGFRATASTILNEHGFKSDHIERQLAHCERNKVRASYNYAQYLPERREMMQWWADYLDTVAIKDSQKITHFGSKI